MNELLCGICLNIYEVFPLIRRPIMLPCHDTFCSICVEDLMRTKDPECPAKYCRKKIEKLPLSEFLANIPLGNLSVRLDSFDQFQDSAFETYVHGITRKLEDVQEILSHVNDKSKSLKFYKNNVKREKLMAVPRKIVDDLELELKDIKNKFIEENDDGSIDVGHTQNKETFLNYLMGKLAKGQKIFAAGIVKDRRKYGQVSLIRNGIRVDSLELLDRDKESSFFWLYDFKNYFHGKLCSFFTFPCYDLSKSENFYTMIFDITEGNQFSGFLEICTGEAGSTFKGSSFSLSSSDSFELQLTSRTETKINCRTCNLNIFDENIIIISYISAVKWEIKRIKSPVTELENVVGILIDDISFNLLCPEDPGNRFIKESGIAVLKTPSNNFGDQEGGGSFKTNECSETLTI